MIMALILPYVNLASDTLRVKTKEINIESFIKFNFNNIDSSEFICKITNISDTEYVYLVDDFVSQVNRTDKSCYFFSTNTFSPSDGKIQMLKISPNEIYQFHIYLFQMTDFNKLAGLEFQKDMKYALEVNYLLLHKHIVDLFHKEQKSDFGRYYILDNSLRVLISNFKF
jgi:hypothetical protein